MRGSARITGYRVWRNGRDLAGRRTWTKVVPPRRRSVTVRGLRNGTRYTFSVAALSRVGRGRAARVRRAPAALTDKPVVVQSAPGQPVTLRRGGAAGARLRMAGVCVWGVPDIVAGGGQFATSQHRDRAEVVAGIKSWGANHVRLRVLADDYNNDRQGLSKARRLQMIKDWRDAATSAGLYFSVVWWDSLDGYAEDANWPSRYRSAFAMMADVHRTLGNDDHVFYELFNEPNSFGDQWPAWTSAMRATVSHWRSIGYTGVLVIDTPVWSHAYDDDAMTALETYDAGRPGMGGKHQLAFARHDYANEGWPNGGDTFSGAQWRAATGGSARDHLIWETEFGNFSGDPSTVHPC